MFIRGRSIYDSWGIASEVLDVMKRKRVSFIFKLDFNKAYDCGNYHFLTFVLRKMGFGEWWISWISRCRLVAPISILVNGSPGFRFQIERGLRQGYPLSPLLFNLVFESFPIFINQFQNKGWLEGILIYGLDEKIPIFQYDDDTTLPFRGTNLVSYKIQTISLFIRWYREWWSTFKKVLFLVLVKTLP